MRNLLKKYGIRPRRELGQNFLQDRGVLEREVAYAELQGTETVLEIGAGIGNLTERLLHKAGRVVAVEKDRRFARRLEELGKQHGNLEIVWGDALEVAFPPFDRVVANLPFKPGLPITFKLLEQRFERGVLLLQRRLAERICGQVGEQRYCRLSVAVGQRAEVELLEVIRPNSFFPPPEVDSALVLLRRGKPRFSIPSEDFFRAVLEGLFARREASVEQAAGEIRYRRLSPRVLDRALAALGRKVRGKTVFAVTPREFGRIAWALWNEMKEKGSR